MVADAEGGAGASMPVSKLCLGNFCSQQCIGSGGGVSMDVFDKCSCGSVSGGRWNRMVDEQRGNDMWQMAHVELER